MYEISGVMGWTVRKTHPGGGEIFRTRPGQPCGPLSLLYSGYSVPFPRIRRLGRGVNHPRSSSAEVKETVQLNHFPLWPSLVCSRVKFTFHLLPNDTAWGSDVEW
jgi:hypothetical protein